MTIAASTSIAAPRLKAGGDCRKARCAQPAGRANRSPILWKSHMALHSNLAFGYQQCMDLSTLRPAASAFSTPASQAFSTPPGFAGRLVSISAGRLRRQPGTPSERPREASREVPQGKKLIAESEGRQGRSVLTSEAR
jgi:hypothetical protein